MKSPAFARDRFASLAPADLTDAGENVGDRLLFAVMMNPRSGAWCHLEQATPNGRCDTERRRDSGAAFGARRLRCS